MVFASTTPCRYGRLDTALACELGRRAALAVDSAHLYRAVETAVRLRDDFLSVAAHELNTPLTSLKLTVQALACRRERSPGSDKSALAVADRQVRRLTRLVDELLDVTRFNAGRLEFTLERVDLVGVARDTVEQLAEAIAQSGSTVDLIAPEQLIGTWDRLRLEQVATNLLSNAIKFGRHEPITVTIAQRDGKAVLTVRDHGIGIDPDRVALRALRAGRVGTELWRPRPLHRARHRRCARR